MSIVKKSMGHRLALRPASVLTGLSKGSGWSGLARLSRGGKDGGGSGLGVDTKGDGGPEERAIMGKGVGILSGDSNTDGDGDGV